MRYRSMVVNGEFQTRELSDEQLEAERAESDRIRDRLIDAHATLWDNCVRPPQPAAMPRATFDASVGPATNGCG